MISVYETINKEEYLRPFQLHWLNVISDERSLPAILVNDQIKYQEIIGFGASFTDSSAYLIQQILNERERDRVMTALFDQKNGIGLNMLRNPIGSSDYSHKFYHFAVKENDWDLKCFSITQEDEAIIFLTKLAKKINSDLVLIASPWSAPSWMKTTNSMIGGSLKFDCYQVYAEYLVKYLEIYQDRRLPIEYVTVQNEPLFVPKNYAGMYMSAADQARFIEEYLYPLVQKKQFATKILCYDHNWNRPEYPLEVMRKAKESVDGVAWHWYGGKPEAQEFIAQQFPEKEILFTEGSGGEWVPDFRKWKSQLDFVEYRS